MATLQSIKDLNQINDEELHNIAQIMLDSFVVKDNNESVISKKEIIITSFANFMEQYLKLHFIGSKERKAQLIKFISKLKMQKELLEIASGEISLDDIQMAGKRLSKKSQSAFKNK